MAGKTDLYGEEVSGPALYTMSGLYAQVPTSGPNDSQDNNSDVFPDKLPQVKTTEKQDKVESKSHRRQWSTTSSIVAVVTNNLMSSGSHASDVVVRDCGLGNWRPTFLQKFASVETFVFLISSLVILQQTVCSGYINSVITTVEKRFEIPSSMMGLISSMYEIGNLVTVIFVSYLGSRRHIPFWIGVGAVIMGIGSFIFVLPYFLTDSRHLSDPNSLTNNTQENICQVTIRENDQDEMGLGRLSEGLSAPPLAPHNNIPGRRDNCLEMTSDTALPVFIFMMGQLLLGCGGSPIFTLGTTYIDDHVRKEDSAMYIGIMYSTVAFGPVCGFLLGAYLLSYNVDIFVASSSSEIHQMEQKDPRWIGLWWGGFLICGILFLIVSAPFFTFPKSLERVKEKLKLEEKSKGQKRCRSRRESSVHSNNYHSGGDNHSYGKDIKDIPDSMWRLLCNPVYVVTCLGACMELIIVSGFIVFLPKYLETQFSVSKSQASVFTGGIAIPGACIGIIMGGCMLKRFQLRPGGAVKLVLALNFFCLSLYGFLFFLGCPNVKMAGTTQPYFNSTAHERSQFEVNLTASCNFGCQCSPNEVDPVCGSNGLTYFSACHAGCTSLASKYNYTNCACIKLSEASSATNVFSDVTATPLATNGPCVAQCDTILIFMMILFFMTLVVAVTQMPLLMIVLRSVEEEERSFALGMQFVIFRLFGYIPSPILFGNAIDSTCLLWKEGACGVRSGRCLMYDIEAFHFKYIGIGAGIKIIAAAIFMLDLFLIKSMYKIDMGTLTVGEIVNSVVSIDKVHEDCAGECYSLSDAANWDANITDDDTPNPRVETLEST